jgi:hypothetical protein
VVSLCSHESIHFHYLKAVKTGGKKARYIWKEIVSPKSIFISIPNNTDLAVTSSVSAASVEAEASSSSGSRNRRPKAIAFLPCIQTQTRINKSEAREGKEMSDNVMSDEIDLDDGPEHSTITLNQTVSMRLLYICDQQICVFTIELNSRKQPSFQKYRLVGPNDRTFDAIQDTNYYVDRIYKVSDKDDDFVYTCRSPVTGLLNFRWCTFATKKDGKSTEVKANVVNMWEATFLSSTCPLAVHTASENIFVGHGQYIHVFNKNGAVCKLQIDVACAPLSALTLISSRNNSNQLKFELIIAGGMSHNYAHMECEWSIKEKGWKEAWKDDSVHSDTNSDVSCKELYSTPLCALHGRGTSQSAESFINCPDELVAFMDDDVDNFVILSRQIHIGRQVFFLSRRTGPGSVGMDVMKKILKFAWLPSTSSLDCVEKSSHVFVSNVSMNDDACPVEKLFITSNHPVGKSQHEQQLSLCQEAAELICVDSLPLDGEDEGVRFLTACPTPAQQMRMKEGSPVPVLATARTTKQSALMKLSLANRDEASLSIPSISDSIEAPPVVSLSPAIPREISLPSYQERGHTLLFAYIGEGACVQVTTESLCVIDATTFERRGELCPIKACRQDPSMSQNRNKAQNRRAVFEKAENAVLAASCTRLFATDSEMRMYGELEDAEAFIVLTSGRFVMILSIQPSSGQVFFVEAKDVDEDISAVAALRVITSVDKEPPVRLSSSVIVAVSSWGRDGVDVLTWHGEVERQELEVLSPRGRGGGGKMSPRGSPRPSNRYTDLALVHHVPFGRIDDIQESTENFTRAYGSIRHLVLGGIIGTYVADSDRSGGRGPAEHKSGRTIFRPPDDLHMILTCINGAGDILIASLKCESGRDNTIQQNKLGAALRGAWSHQGLQRYLLRGGIQEVVPVYVSTTNTKSSDADSMSAELGFMAFVVNGTRTDHLICFAMDPVDKQFICRCDRIAASMNGLRRQNFMLLPNIFMKGILPDYQTISSNSKSPLLHSLADAQASYPANIVDHIRFAWTAASSTINKDQKKSIHHSSGNDMRFCVGAVMPSIHNFIQTTCPIPGYVVYATLLSDMSRSCVRQPLPHFFKVQVHTTYRNITQDKVATLLILWRNVEKKIWGVTKFDSGTLHTVWNLVRKYDNWTPENSYFAVTSGPIPRLPGRKPVGFARAEFGEVFTVWKHTDNGIEGAAIFPYGGSKLQFKLLSRVSLWKDQGIPPTEPIVMTTVDVENCAPYSNVLVVCGKMASLVGWRGDKSQGRAGSLKLEMLSQVTFEVPAFALEACVCTSHLAQAEKEQILVAISRLSLGVDILRFSAIDDQLSFVRSVCIPDAAITNLSVICDPIQRAGLGIYGGPPKMMAMMTCIDACRRDKVIRIFFDVNMQDGDFEISYIPIESTLLAVQTGDDKENASVIIDNGTRNRIDDAAEIPDYTLISTFATHKGATSEERCFFFMSTANGNMNKIHI